MVNKNWELNTKKYKFTILKKNYLLFSTSLIIFMLSLLWWAFTAKMNMKLMNIKISNFKLIINIYIYSNLIISLIAIIISISFNFSKKIFVSYGFIKQKTHLIILSLLLTINFGFPIYILKISDPILEKVSGFYTLVPMLWLSIVSSLFIVSSLLIMSIKYKTNKDINLNNKKSVLNSNLIKLKNNFDNTFELMDHFRRKNGETIYKLFKKYIFYNKKKQSTIKNCISILLILLTFTGIITTFFFEINLDELLSVVILSVLIFAIFLSVSLQYQTFMNVYFIFSSTKNRIHVYLPTYLISFFQRNNIDNISQKKSESSKNAILFETEDLVIKYDDLGVSLMKKREKSKNITLDRKKIKSQFIYDFLVNTSDYFMSYLWSKSDFSNTELFKFNICIEFNKVNHKQNSYKLEQIISSILFIGLLTTTIWGDDEN